jgi:integrase
VPVTHFTDLVVSRLQTPGIYYDDTTPAFGIRVGKNRKAWVITRGIDRQRISIGKYPQMTLAEARKEARRRLSEEPRPRAIRVTFLAAYALYKDAITGLKPQTQIDYKRMINRHFLPALGTKKLADISYEDVIATTDGAPRSQKAHALAIARTFFKWCVQPPRRYINHSPLEGIKLTLANPRKRILTDDELRKVWHAAVKQGHPHGTIVQLLILTGQRRGETANLRRPWIDGKQKIITLPEWVTKNSSEHAFPYDRMVRDILETIPRLNSTDLLFPSRASDDRPISGWSKYKKQMDDGVRGWTLHDLRRTFATRLAELGVPPHVVEKLLNHKMGSIGNKADSIVSAVAEVYNRARYVPEMRDAIKRWQNHLSTAIRQKKLAA